MKKSKGKDRIKAPFQGKFVDAKIIPFVAIKEDWNEYKLADGTILRFKGVVAKILRLNAFNPENEPIYQISSQNVAAATVPSKLKKKKK